MGDLFSKKFWIQTNTVCINTKRKKIKNRRDGRHCHWLISYGMTHQQYPNVQFPWCGGREFYRVSAE